MTYFLEWLFWVTSFLVVYPYVVYPPLLAVLARLAPRRARLPDARADAPFVSILVSAYNEESVLEAKIANVLSLDWPSDRLELLVISDASTDRTDEIVRTAERGDSRVRLIRQEQRRGKSAGLNHGVAQARGAIVVFSDANAMYEADALRWLVSGFADPTVGYVVGAALYTDAGGNRAAESEGFYWKLETKLKSLESAFHSVVGGDGAIYAIRRELFWELREDDINDFVNPLQIVAEGYHGLFEPRAKCWEAAGDSFAKEFGRKRRIVNRSWRAFRRYGGKLRLRRDARFRFMLWSHKVVRWLAGPLIGVAWVSNTLLLGEGSLYVVTWFAITLSIVLALVGLPLEMRGRKLPRLVAALHYFYSVNVAGMLGIWDELRGVRHSTWDHIRRSES